MTHRTLLFAPETFNIAETTRMIEIAKACRDTFEPHFCGYGGDFARLVEAEGFPFHILQPAYTPEKIAYLWKIDRGEGMGNPFTTDEVRQRVKSELALYEMLSPAAVVIGFTLSTYVSARVVGIPLVAATPFSFTAPFFQAGLATFPDQYKIPPLSWVPQRWLDYLVTTWAKRTRLWTGPFNDVAREYGLPPFASLITFWEGDHMLVADIPEVTGVPVLPPHWEYIGPIFAKLEGDVPEVVTAVADHHPLIYCAMGSSGNQDLVRAVIESFVGMPYQVIAPVKSHLSGTTICVPDNVLVLDWIPAHKVNPLADLAVIHGGHGTVQTAIAAGTPFVGIGMQPEQEWNINLLVWQGCATRLSRRGFSPQKLHASIRAMLDNPTAYERARTLRQLMAQSDGAVNAARFLAAHFA